MNRSDIIFILGCISFFIGVIFGIVLHPINFSNMLPYQDLFGLFFNICMPVAVILWTIGVIVLEYDKRKAVMDKHE